MHRSRTLLTILLGLALFLAPLAWAQENATITGIVTDSTGAVVPNVQVTLTNQATSQVRTSVSNGSGIYDFPNVGVGNYTLAATAPGFRNSSAPASR